MRKASLFDNSAVLAIMRIGGAGIGFLTQILLARLLGARDLGIFYSVTALAAVGGYITSLGYSQIASRFAGRYRESHKAWLFSTFISRATVDGVVVSCAAALVIAALSFLLPGIELQTRICYAVGGAMIVAATVLAIFTNLAGAVRMFGWCYVPEGIVRPIAFLAMSIALALLAGLTAAKVTILFGLLNALTAIVVVVVMIRVLPDLSWPSRSARRLAGRWRREAVTLVLLSLYINAFSDIGILFATPFMTSADVALFGICLKLSLLIGYAVQVAQQRSVPDLADAHRARDIVGMRQAVRRSLPFPFLLTVGALMGCILFGDKVLALLGSQFSHGRTILVIMVACQVVRALAGPSVHLITLRGAQRLNASLCIGALVLLLGLDAVLAPAYGPTGAAVAVFASYTAWLLGNGAALAYLGEIPTDIYNAFIRSDGAHASSERSSQATIA